ncbi:MAG: glycosyltransferase family 1 protein, partial [Bdellovibrio sp. CG10_big_fil_rev_8_21_14_0_10_47_8]
RQRPFDFVFKREMVNEQSYEKNVFPLPFGLHHQITDRPTPILKTYDVSFWAVESHPIRSQVFSLLKGKFDCDQNGSCAKQVFRKYSRKGEQYLQDLAQTKVSLNFRGVGWDTLRFWETFGVGTMMISQKPAIQIPNDFINGSEVVYLEDGLDSLIDQCRYYLDHSDERERIAKRGQQKAQKFHSAKFRAEQVLSKIFG